MIILLLCLSALSAFAEEGEPAHSSWFFQTAGAFTITNPSALGAELGIALLTRPFAERDLYAGPRVGGAYATGERRDLSGQDYEFERFDALIGIESTLWFGNLIGPGFGVDFVGPSHEDRVNRDSHARFEGFTGFRVARFADSGALGGRVSVLYSTLDRWGAKFGITLQFSGVDTTTAR